MSEKELSRRKLMKGSIAAAQESRPSARASSERVSRERFMRAKRRGDQSWYGPNEMKSSVLPGMLRGASK